MMVLLAAFASLRWGELAALRRSDVDPVAGTVRSTVSKWSWIRASSS